MSRFSTSSALLTSLPDTLSSLQSFATQEENNLWKSKRAVFSDNIWLGPNHKPCLPKHFFPHYAKLTHGLDHVSKGGMLDALTKFWFIKGFSSYGQKYSQACMICATNNAGKGTSVPQAAHPPPTRPFDHLMMEFIEHTPAKGKKYCLVMVDMWSK